MKGGDKYINKKIIFPAVALVIGGVLVSGARQASAQNNTSTYPTVVEKLVSKFNLNEAEVKAVFDEERTARQSEMQAKIDEKLTQAVTDGKITAAQKQAILVKLTEMKANRTSEKEDWHDLTPSERQTKMQEKRTEMESWAKSIGVDPTILNEFMRPFGGKGRHMNMRVN